MKRPNSFPSYPFSNDLEKRKRHERKIISWEKELLQCRSKYSKRTPKISYTFKFSSANVSNLERTKILVNISLRNVQTSQSLQSEILNIYDGEKKEGNDTCT